jgi:hypothetical protein
MKQASLFGDDSGSSAKQARDEALRRVSDHAGSWLRQCMAMARVIATERAGTIVTGEDMRRLIRARIEAPHHHNVWGAVTRDLVRDGILEPTGHWTAMATKRSHARRTPQYRLRAPP